MPSATDNGPTAREGGPYHWRALRIGLMRHCRAYLHLALHPPSSPILTGVFWWKSSSHWLYQMRLRTRAHPSVLCSSCGIPRRHDSSTVTRCLAHHHISPSLLSLSSVAAPLTTARIATCGCRLRGLRTLEAIEQGLAAGPAPSPPSVPSTSQAGALTSSATSLPAGPVLAKEAPVASPSIAPRETVPAAPAITSTQEHSPLAASLER